MKVKLILFWKSCMKFWIHIFEPLKKAMNGLNVISTDIWTPKYFERIVSNVRMYPFAGSGTRGKCACKRNISCIKVKLFLQHSSDLSLARITFILRWYWRDDAKNFVRSRFILKPLHQWYNIFRKTIRWKKWHFFLSIFWIRYFNRKLCNNTKNCRYYINVHRIDPFKVQYIIITKKRFKRYWIFLYWLRRHVFKHHFQG